MTRRQLTVTGVASTDLLLRVVNLAAQRGFDAHRVEARRNGDTMWIALEIDTDELAAAEAVAEKLRSLVEVSKVLLEVSDQDDILSSSK